MLFISPSPQLPLLFEMYVCVYVCMHVCIHVCICVCGEGMYAFMWPLMMWCGGVCTLVSMCRGRRTVLWCWFSHTKQWALCVRSPFWLLWGDSLPGTEFTSSGLFTKCLYPLSQLVHPSAVLKHTLLICVYVSDSHTSTETYRVYLSSSVSYRVTLSWTNSGLHQLPDT